MATKKIKKDTENIVDFSKSIEKIQSSVKTVNNEVLNTSVDVLDDIRKNSTRINNYARTTVKEAIDNLTIENGVKLVKETVKDLNEFSLENVEKWLDVAVKGSKGWQTLFAKTIKGGLEVAGHQQDIALTTLEGIKEQLQKGGSRTKSLLNFKVEGKPTKKEKKPVAKKASKVSTNPAKKTGAKKASKENLKQIEGIGPKIESLLNEAGIFTFAQLANCEEQKLRGVLEAAGPRYKKINPVTLKEKARLFAAGK